MEFMASASKITGHSAVSVTNKKMAANQQFFMPNAAYLVLNIFATLDNWMIEYIIKELSSKDFVKLNSKEREDFSSKIARYINENQSSNEM